MDFLSRASRYQSDERQIATSLIEIGLSSCAHIIIAPRDPSDQQALFHSASGMLIDFDGRPCLITNKHVLDAYREESVKRATVFEFAGVSIDPLQRLYSEDATVDLVVLRLDGLRIDVARSSLSGVPKLQLYKPPKWPPNAPQPGDSVFFAGWPEVGRRIDAAEAEAAFQPYSWTGVKIQSVSDDQFTILFERERFQGVSGWETAEQLAERNLSGLSGTPVFRDTSVVGGLAADLVGFVKQYSPGMDYLVATSALNIRPDGIIQRYHP
jgi:hypothetical protein